MTPKVTLIAISDELILPYIIHHRRNIHRPVRKGNSVLIYGVSLINILDLKLVYCITFLI